VSAGWVAGTVRAKALTRRRLGHDGARALAAGPLPAGIKSLARSPYGRFVRSDDSLAAATRGVAATLLWNARVLAGWLPPRGSETLRVLAGWYEIANVEDHLRGLADLPIEPPFSLGSLATAWPRLSSTTSPDELRTELGASRWGDPGGTTPRDFQLAMRLAWVERLTARVASAATWALGGAALLLAREVLVLRQPLSEHVQARVGRILGTRWSTTATLPEFRASLPADARWVLRDIADVDRLWEAEALWWRRLHADSAVLQARSGFGIEVIVGAVGLLAFDAWLVTGALAGAGRGDDAVEVFDAVA
jgi:hypothetical protein